MKPFMNKLILRPVKTENKWDYEDKDEVKLGELAYPFKGKIDDEIVEIDEKEQVFYQYGTKVKIDGEEFELVSVSNLILQK